ncbi:ABC transporter ATP-binding protein [Sulfobacillus thermosulfidooxidans]|uniref:ABC transporter ATP-binding protein n=1 Tax=Sulfobacillus thermosulfidooxidans TaxID=28034 RepID=UPI00040C846B|nr:ABC transporter ATP-binding protein [Sulfobacillus thermosulfidooxidans]
MKPILQVEGLHHEYFINGTSHLILQDVTFAVDPGQFVCLIGPSGAGKTTLFNLLAGIIPVQTGSIRVHGQPLGPQQRAIGYMLQKDLLLPWRTILDNVLLGIDVHRRRRTAEDIDRARSYLDRYGLAGYENAYPNQLSGGMRQRVALIRTLMVDPAIILLDEPFSALDYQTRLLLEKEVLDINQREHKTLMLITHDIGEAISLADTIIVLSARPARVKAHHHIYLTLPGSRTPWDARKAPEYQTYFDTLWHELGIDPKGGTGRGSQELSGAQRDQVAEI